jgi:hypothetical protein
VFPSFIFTRTVTVTSAEYRFHEINKNLNCKLQHSLFPTLVFDRYKSISVCQYPNRFYFQKLVKIGKMQVDIKYMDVQPLVSIIICVSLPNFTSVVTVAGWLALSMGEPTLLL